MAFTMKGKGAPQTDINVTPLIDVVLVLLIIFMVITPRVVHEMSANMPSQHQHIKRPKTPSTQLVVAAYDNGDLALNTRVMGREDLHRDLRARLRARPNKVVFLDAHPNLPYGHVISVMDLVRDAGAERVGMARLKDEGPARAVPAEETEAREAQESSESG
jgi:biopolymer transport protein ExbD